MVGVRVRVRDSQFISGVNIFRYRLTGGQFISGVKIFRDTGRKPSSTNPRWHPDSQKIINSVMHRDIFMKFGTQMPINCTHCISHDQSFNNNNNNNNSNCKAPMQSVDTETLGGGRTVTACLPSK
jgi:hypothetical protein